MRPSNLLQMLRARWKAFASSRDGNVAVIFTLAVLPIAGFIGAAVDYSRANAVRVQIQAALDAAALTLSKEAASLTQAQLEQKAHDYFFALFNPHNAASVTVNTPRYTTDGGSQLTLSAHAVVKSDFMKLVGLSQMIVGTEAKVRWGNTRLRVALALDNTGSMKDNGKMDALKKATYGLLNSLKNAAAKDGDVYVSIIPFSRDVNVDSKNYNADWVDWTDFGSCSKGSYATKGSCLSHKGKWTATSDHASWNGCVKDRGPEASPGSSPNDYDVNNAVPNPADPASLFMAEQYANCPSALLPLTYNWSDLTKKVDAMFPDGDTNQTIGLQWAWQSLSETAPLNAPPIINDGIPTTKIIILLTDGLNTQNRWSTKQTTIDDRTKIACDNVKNAGIVLYTVQVNTGGDPLSTMLKSCPSPFETEPKGDKFYHLTDGDQVVMTFNQIGTSLTKLRVAK